MAKIYIVYGTTGGNTQVVCEKVFDILKQEGHEVSLHRVETTDPKQLKEADVLIFGCPTYGHGEWEPHFLRFTIQAAGLDLGGIPCGIIGLGDEKYDDDYHLESIGLLTQFVIKSKGKVLPPPLAIRKAPLPYLTKEVPQWATQFSETIQKNA